MGTKSSALAKAKKVAGGNVGLGRLLGITSQAVSQWDEVPPERVIAVEKATGVSRYELRPDLHPTEGPQPTRRYPGEAEQGQKKYGHFSRFKHLRKSHFDSGEEISEHVRALREEWDRR